MKPTREQILQSLKYCVNGDKNCLKCVAYGKGCKTKLAKMSENLFDWYVDNERV